MPLTWNDRIKMTVSAGGTGTITLGAAVTNYQAFAAGDDAKLFAYVIEDGAAWETGYGTYTHSGTTFARTSRTASSTGAALNVTTAAFLFGDLISNIVENSQLGAQGITPGGRLTLTSGNPITTNDNTAKTTIYYTPLVHNIINLWDGNIWKTVVFAEVTQALGTLTSAKPYDVFGYLSSGALATETLVWTNDTTRATAVTLQDGRYCKSGDKTRLYLGSFYTTATTTTEDSDAKRYLYNCYNRAARKGVKTESTGHTYTTASYREWNNATAARVNFLDGLGAQAVLIVGNARFDGTAVAELGYISFALNSTTAVLAGTQANYLAGTGLNAMIVYGAAAGYSLAGLNYATILEYGITGVTYSSAGTVATMYL